MHVRSFIPVVLALALIGGACSESDGSGSGGEATVDLAAIDMLAEAGFSGVVAVIHGGDVDVVGMGSAEPDADVSIGPDTAFDVGSITKQFTAAAIVNLQLEGRLLVDDRLGDHVDGLPADKADITLHELLTHTSGLPSSLGFDYDPIDRDSYVELVAETALENRPGEAYAYSNVGYSLLAAVIEGVTGDTYETYLRASLFEPAGMADTGYVLPDWSDNTVAAGYLDATTYGRPNEQVWSDDGPYWHLLGNGGILSTAADMLRWDGALRGDAIFDDDAKALLFSPHVSEGGSSFYGYGWVIVPLDGDRTLVTHNGGNGVFFADYLRFVDDDLTIFIATNSADPSYEEAGAALASEVLGEDIGGAADFECPPILPEDIGELPSIDEFPPNAAGRAAERVFEVVTAEPGTVAGAGLSEFANAYLRPVLSPDATADEIAGQVESLQQELAPFALEVTVALDDGVSFAGLFTGEDEPLVVTVRVSDGDPAHLRCLNVDG